MLDLLPRTDLEALSDIDLANRLELAFEAMDTHKRRWGFMYGFYSLSFGWPRARVDDPREYWIYPSHVHVEIRQIVDEMKKRVARRDSNSRA